MSDKEQEQDKRNLRSVWSYMIAAIRLFFWPRGGWRRTIRYVMVQMARMPSSPYAVAIGFASGAFISFTPFLGFHFLGAAGIAWVLRGNIVASALGTIMGNPFSFPFIWILDYVVGTWILKGHWLSYDEVVLPTEFSELFYPILVGSVPSGSVCALLVFILVYIIVRVYRRRKAMRDAADD